MDFKILGKVKSAVTFIIFSPNVKVSLIFFVKLKSLEDASIESQGFAKVFVGYSLEKVFRLL